MARKKKEPEKQVVVPEMPVRKISTKLYIGPINHGDEGRGIGIVRAASQKEVAGAVGVSDYYIQKYWKITRERKLVKIMGKFANKLYIADDKSGPFFNAVLNPEAPEIFKLKEI